MIRIHYLYPNLPFLSIYIVYTYLGVKLKTYFYISHVIIFTNDILCLNLLIFVIYDKIFNIK